MIYESAVTETFEIFPLAWVPIGIIIAIGVLTVLGMIFAFVDDDAEAAGGLFIAGITVSVLVAVFGILAPSSFNNSAWEREQIQAALEARGYTQVDGSANWSASLDGDYRLGTASVSDNIVTIKDLTDLEVVN